MSGLIERDIFKGLQTSVTAAVAASTVPAFPVKYKGIVFTVPNDDKWLEIVIVPNNRSNEYWGGERTYQGLMRLLLHWSNKSEGVYDPLLYVAEIADWFTKDKTVFQGAAALKFYDNPSLTSVIEGGPDLIFPVSISYRSFRP